MAKKIKHIIKDLKNSKPRVTVTHHRTKPLTFWQKLREFFKDHTNY